MCSVLYKGVVLHHCYFASFFLCQKSIRTWFLHWTGRRKRPISMRNTRTLSRRWGPWTRALSACVKSLMKASTVTTVLFCFCYIIALRNQTTSALTCMLFYQFIPYLLFPVEFKEPKVIELWEMARRSNLSEDELDSLKVTCFWGPAHFRSHTARFISRPRLLERFTQIVKYQSKQYESLICIFM